ncbi:MAG UNVERIFIED_CONTAM: heme o synthase [Rickettsiaceae bacterium]
MKVKLLQNNSETLDYFSLMKPRVMSLVVFSGIVGLVLNPGTIHPFVGIIAILCIALGAGSSGAINMWYDRDIDSIMKRTQKRPIVLGKVSPEDALTFGIIAGFFSVFIMAVCVNYLASILLLFTILFYVFVYTMLLKRITPQNIVIGGLAGALPPLIGWASVTNSVSIEPLTIVLIIFLWTPPHFWALALYRSDDYKKADVPMMPVIYGDNYTKIQILIYTLLTVASSILPYVVGICGIIYLITSLFLGAIFIYYAIYLLRDYENKYAMRMFFFSIIIFVRIIYCNAIGSLCRNLIYIKNRNKKTLPY